MLLLLLIWATLLFMITVPICFIYKENLNWQRIIIGLLFGLIWPIGMPILILTFFMNKFVK
jgi:hypothetical protein